MPIQATIRLDVLTLFHNIWSNPDTTVHEAVKYILKMSDDNSVTWAVHVRLLCQQYSLPDPLGLLEREDAWPKSKWRNWCMTKVRSYHEKLWRVKSLTNSKMTFLNIQLSGLSGRHHPVLLGLQTTRDVEKLRPHLKMLTSDYLTYSRIANDSKAGDPSCRLCRDSYTQSVDFQPVYRIVNFSLEFLYQLFRFLCSNTVSIIIYKDYTFCFFMAVWHVIRINDVEDSC